MQQGVACALCLLICSIENVLSVRQALEIRRRDPHVLLMRGNSFLSLGIPDSALRDATTILRADAANYKALLLKACGLWIDGVPTWVIATSVLDRTGA